MNSVSIRLPTPLRAVWEPVRRPSLRALTALLLISIALLACTRTEEAGPAIDFDGNEAYAWVEMQCDLGYRIPGTNAHWAAGDLIASRLEELGWSVQEQTFEHLGVTVRNLLAWQGEGPAVLLGAHYDTRASADQEDPAVPVMGANDGASGVAVLLELARTLNVDATNGRVYLAFFDAEDGGGLNGWDWIVGSSYMAAHWGENGETPLDAVVVVDLVGDRDLQVYYERNSDPELSAAIWQTAARLGYEEQIIPQYRHAMLDDHIPFVQRGIPTALMIDFDYPYWHTTQDTPDKVSPESLEIIGRTLQVWLEEGRPQRPPTQ
jgi:glutaminyl-peptide cyclotransferase